MFQADESRPKEEILDTTPLDAINATLSSLNKNKLFDSDSTVDDDTNTCLFKKTLHAILDDICSTVRGFKTIATYGKTLQKSKSNKAFKNELALKSYKEMTQDDLSLETLRAAIDRNCFKTFDEFEFALFRVIEQSNQQLMSYQAYFNDRHTQMTTLMKQ